MGVHHALDDAGEMPHSGGRRAVAPIYPLDLAGRLRPAMLVLADGTEFLGYSFGYPGSVGGEVVFNTGMVGYPESLTDPSYEGQILVLTYPLIGNYGVPSSEKDEHGLPKYFEGDRIYVRALVVADYDNAAVTAHFRAENSLSAWMNTHKVPAIAGVDTRALTKHLREVGCMLGKIVVLSEEEERRSGLSLSALAALPSATAAEQRGENDATVTPDKAEARLRVERRQAALTMWEEAIRNKAKNLPWEDPNKDNLVALVSRKEVRVYKSTVVDPNLRDVLILCVDCGMKYNIYRQLLHSKFEHCNIILKVVPWDFDFGNDEFDGLFISNGPGDPERCEKTVANIRRVMERKIPIFGICLGNQLLALAAGARTYKMKYGNRGMNQPVIDLRTSRCYITPQNHGFAVDESTLPRDFLPLFVNANDRSNEGIIHRTLPFFSAQFHPEASGGPTDTFYLFGDFIASIMKAQTLKQVHTTPFSFPQKFQKVLLLGSGGLSIGQAGEFDYSGSQAIKALKEQNIFVVVVNPNIATVQTSQHMADRVYFLPVTDEFVTKVIEKEMPDGILCTFGGQTALNCAVKLHEQGVLAKFGCKILGSPIEAIIATEDRKVFAAKLEEIGEKVAESAAATNTEEAVQAAKAIGYPVLIRAAFALGGLGSGFAEDEETVRRICKEAFSHSSQVFVDKSLKGWKEVEYEVVRDCKNNCITVCNMENLDPLGIHTGDSIVVAPSQTLSNEDYYRLRDTALKVIRHFGIVGECNIQYALDPNSEKYYIVEVNARLSRSSALASKATGYPLAYIAAKLALGSTLVELSNSVTKETTACFEPSLDYVVTKVPRWDLRKFESCDPLMGSAMKSVGEVMAIGRTFEESLQKALRMVDEKAGGFDESVCHFFSTDEDCAPSLPGSDFKTSSSGECMRGGCGRTDSGAERQAALLEAELRRPSPNRIWALALAFQLGWTVDALHEKTKIDKWFLSKLQNINDIKRQLTQLTLDDLTRADFFYIKKYGFSDRQIAQYLMNSPSAAALSQFDVRRRRLHLGVRPSVKQIDTLAAEFPAHTNYLYLTYQGIDDDVSPLAATPSVSAVFAGARAEKREEENAETCRDDEDESLLRRLSKSSSARLRTGEGDAPGKQCFVVLGCGCYRIGSSVEFDWSAVSCVRTLRSLGHHAIVVNCNPETVSTDYDVSDRLYFEDLSLETVLNIWDIEAPAGVIISVGGQTPNTLCSALEKQGVRIVGTSVAAIDCCEDRHKFSRLCDELNIDQPRWKEFTDLRTAKAFCQEVGYPVLVRPSYVLSGAAMRVVTDDEQLDAFLKIAAVVSGESPVVISKFVENAKEVEFDSVACRGEIVNFAISEHVENAGTHSGDATLILPGQKLYVETIRRVKKISQKLARALQVSGPFNIQFICKQNDVKVIECNLRASRTFPFISKAFNVNLIDLATKVMIGAPVTPLPIHLMDLSFVCVKVPVFSFARLRGCDPVLGVEMRSTGEVACFGASKHEAFLKALISAGVPLPLEKRTILISAGPLWSKMELEPYFKILLDLGFTIYATEGTYRFLMNSVVRGQGTHLPGNASPASDSGLRTPTTAESDADACIRAKYASRIIRVRKPIVGSNESHNGGHQSPHALSLIESGKVEMVINVPDSMNHRAATNGYLMRRTATDCGVPLLTNVKVASMFVEALNKKEAKEAQGRSFWDIRSWDEYWPQK
ncbi:carbamoylphosphate synthetase [Toxoplasma gondii GT1]|uniref:Carbamoylphosphate synthetase n=3 Tax=Toxoplasma gondii TaxID=5811 RepID=S7UPU1_TOXGG|nr:carbamoylphosphate synthetase [Toxoplasma gondii GT1]KAF4640012.1 carbamoylphosphate synthetase [Toxoplasma gondii]